MGTGLQILRPGRLHFDAGKLRAGLDEFGIASSFEIYSGTHTNAEVNRFQNQAMPLFNRILFCEARCG
jgi:hypothetical protein